MAKSATDRLERQEVLRKWEPYNFEGSVEAVIKELQICQEEATSQGWYGLHISVDHYYEDVTMEVRAWRLETDAEYAKRMETHRAHLEKTKKRKQRALERAQEKLKKTEEEERQLYEQLKKKFEQ